MFEANAMKLFKLDLMTALILVVAFGVVITMSTQASVRDVAKADVVVMAPLAAEISASTE